jgi:probable HAF family extracellular repeat protein
MRIVRGVFIVAFFAIVGLQSIAAQSPDSIVDLGTLGGTRTTPIGLNDLGEVVGLSFLAGDLLQRPFLWIEGTMQQLDLLPGHTTGHARAINNSHQAVGLSFPPGIFPIFDSRAVLWENGNVIDLNTRATAAGGLVLAAAFDINDDGQIVGYGFRNGTTQRAFVFDNGVVTDLGTLGGAQAIATSINEPGQVSGMAQASDGLYHAVTWTNGIIKDLGRGPGTAAFNLANWINDLGETAGSWAASSGSIPMHWDAAGTPIPLPPIGTPGSAFAINNAKQIVGVSASSAVVWENGGVIDLETFIPLGHELTAANAINNAGQVAGQLASGRGFLMQLPVTASSAGALIESLVEDAGVAASLLAKINGAAGSPVAECNALRAMANEIRAQDGKKIPTDIAAELLANIAAASATCH